VSLKEWPAVIRTVVAALSLAALLPLLPAQAQPGAAVLFQNVRIFDGRSDTLSAPSNVLVRDNKIAKISSAAITAEAAPTVVIDGGGRVLMPGLIDAHWHAMLIRPTPAIAIAGDVGYNNLLAAAEATDTLMRGFTTVRDVGGPAFGLKQAIDDGLVPRPSHLPVRRHDHGHQRPWRLPAAYRTAKNDRRHALPDGAGRRQHGRG
jgi:imidazolonepropionase-like amidohydrolase